MTRPIRAGPAAPATTVIMTGSTMPPPSSWTTRKAIRLSAFVARAQSVEPIRKTERPSSHTRLAPKRITAQPATGTARATASRQPVVTHSMVAGVACNSPPSVLIPTLTIVASR